MDTAKAILSTLAYPLTIVGSKNRSLKNYTIYGNVGGVGDLGGDNKYIIPIVARGKNIFDLNSTTLYVTNATEASYENGVQICRGNVGLSENAASSGQFMWTFPKLKTINKQITISLYITLFEVGVYGYKRINLLAGTSYSDYSIDVFKPYVSLIDGERYKCVWTFTPTYDIGSLTFRLNNCKWAIELNTLQIEVGDEFTGYEQYKPITTKNIILDAPLLENQSINYKTDNLPPLPQFKGTTIYETDTAIKPSRIQVEYY